MAHEVCRLCETTVNPWTASPIAGICKECTEKLGLVPMPPPRRRPQPCTRCNGMKFIRVIPREYTAYPIKNGYVRQAAPMAATQLPQIRERLLFPGNVVEHPSVEDGRGALETYICAGCGFVEWYCHDPETIPIGPEYMTDVVDYTGGSPYR